MKGKGMLVGNFEALQETDPGVAQAFFTPKRDYVTENTDNTDIFIFFHMQP